MLIKSVAYYALSLNKNKKTRRATRIIIHIFNSLEGFGPFCPSSAMKQNREENENLLAENIQK